MSTPPFSRPGAVDLSALARPASPPPGTPDGAASAASAGSVVVDVAEADFQAEQQPAPATLTQPTTTSLGAGLAAVKPLRPEAMPACRR